jgi:hypothetical protein
MKKLIFILLVLSVSTHAHKRSCLSDTFQNIKSKTIAEMSDDEYRLFDHYYDHCFKCDTCNRCKGKYLLEIKDKSINQMKTNEYDYFLEILRNCDSTNPCELKQYLEIKNKNKSELTNTEFDFYNKCKDECGSYVKRPKKRIFFWILFPTVALIALACGIYYLSIPPRY